MNASKKADRVELDWVQFVTPTRPHRGDPIGTQVIVADGNTRLVLGEFAGIPCVIVENATYSHPAKIPLTSVAAFGAPE